METPPTLPHEVWERTPPEAQAYIRALEARVETMASMVDTLQEQVRTLQDQLNQTSQNSSRPPSSDPPQHRRPHRPQSHRRRGGQPGHPGHTRTLIPVQQFPLMTCESYATMVADRSVSVSTIHFPVFCRDFLDST